MSGRKSRAKGHTFERTIAAMMRLAGFEECKTSREASTFADACKIDLVNTGKYAIQCKTSGKNWASINELFKIQHEKYAKHIAASGILGVSVDTEKGGDIIMSYNEPKFVPILITKIDRKEAVVCMPLDEFLSLIEHATKKD